MERKMRKTALFMTLALLLSMFPISAFATGGFMDMPNNWSTDALHRAVNNGLLKGSNGMIMPNSMVTRAEMAAIITRAFGAQNTASLSKFTDVSSKAWYFDPMSKAYQMGILMGSNGMLYPNRHITREEAFVMVARAIKADMLPSNKMAFADESKIASWAAPSLHALATAGYIKGSSGGINPKGHITRAEMAQLMDNLVKNYVSGNQTVSKLENGSVMVNGPNAVIKDTKINGDLIVGDGVGNQELTLDNVVVTGRVVVRGGGANSIIITGNSSIQRIILTKVDGKVAIKVEGAASVETIFVPDGSSDVIITGAVGKIEIDAPGVEVALVNATVGEISIQSAGSTLNVDKGSTVTTVTVSESASGTQLVVNGTVTTVTTSAPNTAVSGTGTVSTVVGKGAGDNVAVTTPGTSVTLQPTTPTTPTTPVTPTPTPTPTPPPTPVVELPQSLTFSVAPGSLIVSIDSIVTSLSSSISFAIAQSTYGLNLENSSVTVNDGHQSFVIPLSTTSGAITIANNQITVNTNHASFQGYDANNFNGTEYVTLNLAGTYSNRNWSISKTVTGLDNISVYIAQGIVNGMPGTAFENLPVSTNILTAVQSAVDAGTNGVVVSIFSSSDTAIVNTSGSAIMAGSSNVVFALTKGTQTLNSGIKAVSIHGVPPVLNSDTTLSGFTVKGTTGSAIELGQPGVTSGSAISFTTPGAIVITSGAAITTSGAITVFTPTSGLSSVKVVKYAAGATDYTNFNSAAAYNDEVILNQEIFIIRVTAQDGSIGWYKVIVTVGT